MTYTTLTADTDIMRAGNEDVFKDFNNEDLEALYYSAAKIEMKLDIEQALSIEYDDDGSTLDDTVTMHQVRLQRALAFKQLSLYYQRFDTGAETKNRSRWELYVKLYERERSQFGSLLKTVPSSRTDSVQIWR